MVAFKSQTVSAYLIGPGTCARIAKKPRSSPERGSMSDSAESVGLLEQTQNVLTVGIGNAEDLNAELRLHLERLQPG